MKPEELEAIEARAAKATKGPWSVEDPLAYPSIVADGHKEAYDWDFIAHLETGEVKRSVKADRNAAFIAAARQDIPDLIAEVRRLREAQRWQPIETAPRDGSRFLAFGSYLYPYDTHETKYMELVEFSGDDEFPWLDVDGKNRPDVYSHWMPLPTPPVQS